MVVLYGIELIPAAIATWFCVIDLTRRDVKRKRLASVDTDKILVELL